MKITAFCLLLAAPAMAATDYVCLDRCSAQGYSWAYCRQACTIYEQPSQARPANPAGAFIEGRKARQEAEARELELQRMRAEQARREREIAEQQAAAEKAIWEEAAKEAAAQKRAEEDRRRQEEIEALKKELQELKEKSKQD